MLKFASFHAMSMRLYGIKAELEDRRGSSSSAQEQSQKTRILPLLVFVLFVHEYGRIS